jgi:hypothetical protein
MSMPAMTITYDKTDKGREEIATRKYQLAPRLRTLLVMIDGKQNADDLLKKVTALGLGEQQLSELLEQGFIQTTAQSVTPSPARTPLPAAHAAAPAASTAAATDSISPDSVLGLGHNTDQDMSDAERFKMAYNFFNETIKSTIGLRGYALQLKVERAGSLDEFRELRRSYLEAVQKAKGNEMARSLRDRLDQILYPDGKPSADTILN